MEGTTAIARAVCWLANAWILYNVSVRESGYNTTPTDQLILQQGIQRLLAACSSPASLKVPRQLASALQMGHAQRAGLLENFNIFLTV